MKHISIFIWLFIWVASFQVSAQQVISVEKKEKINLGTYLEFFVDSSSNLSLMEVMLQDFVPSTSQILNLANIPHNVWVRFSLESPDEEELFLQIDNALLEHLELYNTTDKDPQLIFEGGYSRPFGERPISSENFQLHLPIQQGTKQTFYLKASSPFPMMLPLTVFTEESFIKQNQQHNLFWGFYIGAIVFAFLYNFFIFFSVREKTYLYYILYILGSSVFYLGLQGYSFKYLWPDIPSLNTKLGFLISVTNIIITLFSMSFLQITRKQKGLFYFGWATIIAYGLVAGINLTPVYPLGLGLAQMLSLVTCVYFIYAAIARLLQGVKSAKYYLIAWTIFLVMVMIYILTINGLIQANFFTIHSIFIGHVTEVLLLSFALADRINILKTENDLKQKEIIRQLEENEQLQTKVNKELEEKVKERTKEVVRQKNEAEAQRARSDELLLNILPQETAEELKTTGMAKAKHINEVTVLFTDIQNFTSIAESLSPTELVFEINECFSAFDRIMEKYGVEKIKTIGDSYMAAGGLPIPNETHAVDVVNAALDIQEFMEKFRKSKFDKGGLPYRIRIGIHTGPVVAGIVGIKKFAYDIWGDTVNLASRMESACEVDKVNISETTYLLVKDHFKCTFRGLHEAKNKGMINMYFVERKS